MTYQDQNISIRSKKPTHFHKICLICDVIQWLKGIAAKCEGHFSRNQQKQLLQLQDQRV